MSCLLLVDGSDMLFRMFFGMPSRIKSRQGRPIHRVLGFVGALLKIIGMTKPTHIVVLFDGEHENTRTTLNDAYKANRVDYSSVPEEDNPFSQLTDIYRALDFLGIQYYETTTCEADDLIAGNTLMHKASLRIVISSLDSDFFQLIDDNVSVLRYRGKSTVICDSKYIYDKFGTKPLQYADFKALTGDSSDNIKGAERVGPKTAAMLLNHFNTLNAVLAEVDSINKPSIQSSIAKDSDKLRTNYKIIKLEDMDELAYAMNELEFHDKLMYTSKVLSSIGLYP